MAFTVPALAALLGLVALGFTLPQNAIVGSLLRTFVHNAGYTLTYDALHAGLSEATLSNVHVTANDGQPVFDAAKLDVHYSLRDLLPGSKHRFGLTAVDVAQPTLTLIHNANGSYNVALPAGGAPQKPDTTPIDLRVRVRNGSVLLRDDYTVSGQVQLERIVGLHADVVLSPVTHSYYDVGGDLLDRGRHYPIVGRARFDARRGLEDQRWSAPALPIGPIVNFGLSTHAIRIVDGELRDVGVQIGTFVDPDGTTHPHVGGRATLGDGKIFVARLTTPIRNGHGVLQLYDDGVTTKGLDATLGGVPLHAAGGVYGLAAPSLRFAAHAAGRLEQLRAITAETRRFPVAGPVRIDARVGGPIRAPLVLASIAAPTVSYRGYRFDDVGASIALQGTTLDLLRTQVRYGPLRAGVYGTVALEQRVRSNLVATVAGDADRLPYAAHLLRGLQLSGVVHLAGEGARLASNGIAYGDARDGRLDALFGLDADGRGSVGPIALERDDGASIYGRAVVDRPAGIVSGVLAARDLTLLTAPPQRLPGLSLPDIAAVPGRVDADLAATTDGNVLSGAAGTLRARDVQVGRLAASADAQLQSTGPGRVTAHFTATSNAGALSGDGAFDAGALAFDGRFRSSFSQLRPLLGDVGGRGSFDAHLLAHAADGTVVAQIASLAFHDASLRGIALREGSGTVVRRSDGAIEVPALRVESADGRILASGALGRQKTLAAIAALDLQSLGNGAAGARGTALAFAAVDGPLSAPRAALGLAVTGGRVRGVPFIATGDATYAGDALHLDDATVVALGGYATARGTISDVRRAPQLAVDASLRDLDVATAARVAKLPLRYPEGSVEADVRASGPVAAARFAGAARIPEGALNGLRFRDAHIAFDGSRGGVAISEGGVAVGTTAIALSGFVTPAAQSLHLRAPRADLADFNDYFDVADTFAGRGALAVDLALAPNALRTAGTIGFTGTRVRRFDVGDVGARWRTAQRTVALTAFAHGAHGRADAALTATLPAARPLRDPMHRTRIVADASVDGFDLATWLPAAGLQAPILGIIAARAHAAGEPAAPTFRVSGSLANGLIGAYRIETATIAANGDRRTIHLTQGHVAATGLVADLTGTAGYRASDPVALALHAETPAIDTLVRAAGRRLDVAGAATIDARLNGTRTAPQLAATLAATNLRLEQLVVPRVRGDVTGDRNHIAIANAEADLAHGRLLLDADAPISLAAPMRGLRDARIAATLRADALDLGDVESALPKGTKLAGRIDGTIRASGTAAAPVFDGRMTLANGSYASPLLRSPLTDLRGTLALAGRDVRLDGLHATAGGGSLDGAGTAQVGDLRDLAHHLVFDASVTARRARLDVNPYGRATIDGTIRAYETAGGPPTVAGTITASQTRIALTALLPKGGGGPSPAPLPPVALDLTVTAANDVRVQSGNVDIGARGQVAVGGTLNKPELSGAIHSTDGTLSFYRNFVLQRGTVAFAPSDGLIPTVNATATTHVDDPSTDILLQVSGPATALNLQLASNPSYDREQILGLLVNAQALGAVSGIAATGSATGGGFSVANLGGDYLSQQFTRSLLQPLGSQLGNALGFENLALGYSFTNGLSAGATRTLGKNLTASFSESFGTNQRQSIALADHLGPQAALQLTVYSATATTLSALSSTQSLFAPAGPTNYTLEAAEPPTGSSGYVFTYQRKFW